MQTSLVGLINAISAPFRRQATPQFSTTPPTSAGRATPGKGAPIYSYAWGQNPGYATGARPMDITRFAPVYQPSGGLFAPGYPLVPVEYERTRRLNFPVGINTIYTPRSFEAIGFADLKALANDDITRLCIETRKDQIEKLQYVIKPRNEKDVAGNAKARIQQLTEFWAYPDGITPFATWLRQLMDQVLVADCPALEPRRNRGGELIALDIIEGSTIKVLIDDTGRRPRPPAPAYQQIIHGRPWVMLQDGSRSNTEEGEIFDEFTDQELIYFPRNPRADHLYGFSPVEQIVLTINTSIRRGVMQLQHFTIGNVPAGLVNAPANWTPEQIASYQDWFDSKLAGNTGERQKLLWGPEGAKYQAIKEAPLKDDFDEWRARVICFAFSLPPTAFTKQVNRNTAETAQEAALEEGLAPLMTWVARLVNGIIQRRMGHPDLEFAWSDAVPVSPKEQADMVVELTGAGLQTLNEGRDVLGLGPVEGGDEIMFKTATGPVTLDSILNPPEPPPPMLPNVPPSGDKSEPNGPNGKNPPAKQGKPGGKNPSRAGKPPQEQGKEPQPKSKPGEKPAGKPKTEVGKAADSPFGKRSTTPRRNTALLEATRTRLQRRFETFFAERAKDVAAQLARELRLEGWEALGRAASANELDDRLESGQSRHAMKAGGEFNEDAHPRDEHGRFTDGGGSLVGSVPDNLTSGDRTTLTAWTETSERYEELRSDRAFARDVLSKFDQHDGTSYRGISLPPKDVAALKSGASYTFGKNTPTSKESSNVEHFATMEASGGRVPVVLAITGNAGRDISGIARTKEAELEVVMPIGTKATVASIKPREFITWNFLGKKEVKRGYEIAMTVKGKK